MVPSHLCLQVNDVLAHKGNGCSGLLPLHALEIQRRCLKRLHVLSDPGRRRRLRPAHALPGAIHGSLLLILERDIENRVGDGVLGREWENLTGSQKTGTLTLWFVLSLPAEETLHLTDCREKTALIQSPSQEVPTCSIFQKVFRVQSWKVPHMTVWFSGSPCCRRPVTPCPSQRAFFC